MSSVDWGERRDRLRRDMAQARHSMRVPGLRCRLSNCAYRNLPADYCQEEVNCEALLLSHNVTPVSMDFSNGLPRIAFTAA